MPDLIPVLTKDDIHERIVAVAREVSTDYADRDLILIGILKGSFIFLSDFARQLSIPVQIDFIGVSSYGAGTVSSGVLTFTKEIGIDVKDRDILIVEDIVDSGRTLARIVDYLRSIGPRSVKVCTLIDKRERRFCEVPLDYVCHVVDRGFLVGYGLDYAEDYRQLPEIYHLKL
jgi:hypoxanthine phosphoribosyltransferase